MATPDAVVCIQPRSRRDADLHAGGHLRHGEGDDAANAHRDWLCRSSLATPFHLWLRPGTAIIDQFKGLHDFMGWRGPILTDSGGFQVWSLGELRKITEEGVHFASPINGDRLFLSPEVSMQIQRSLNSDIVMQLDECTPADATYEQAQARC